MKVVEEFNSSVKKAIEKMAREQSCDPDEIQVALELNALEQNVYKVCKNYSLVKTAKFGDVVLNPMANLFKSTIESKIKKCLEKLSKEYGSNFITVFLLLNKKQTIRTMLYVKGAYKSELSAEELI